MTGEDIAAVAVAVWAFFLLVVVPVVFVWVDRTEK